MEHIVKDVCEQYNLFPVQLLENGRTPYMVSARTTVSFIARKKEFSFMEIGKALKRHHSSLMSLLKGMDERFGYYPEHKFAHDRACKEYNV